MKLIFVSILLVSVRGYSQSDSVKTIIVEKPKEKSCFVVAAQDTIYEQTCLDTVPSFESGSTAMYQYIGKRIQYPIPARELGIYGKVYVQFFIYEDGSVHDAKILKGIHVIAPDSTKQDDFDDAAKLMNDGALEVIAGMPKWHPGCYKGKRVKTRFVVPINFKLK